MVRLVESLNAWDTPAFAEVFKAEVAQLGVGALPLQQGLSASGYALEHTLDVMLIHADATPFGLRVKAGLFYSGVIAGCSCADDPTPMDENREYCEVLFEIERPDGETHVTLL